ncbi:MAG: hypothetical protein LC791_09555 [Acidobacteria bacterium]|nr:hypothetical protein [Acidobacteriota bacterium]
MCARHGALALVVASHEIACHREPLEIFGFQRGLPLGHLQQSVRFGPRLSLECFPPTF